MQIGPEKPFSNVLVDRERHPRHAPVMLRPTAACLTLLACLPVACTGADQLGEPWGSPMQYTTALPDTPYPPRDLVMFDGVNGRVVMWADIMRLVRRTDVIVVDGSASDAGAVAARNALVDDVQSSFPPVVVVDCDQDADACADLVHDAWSQKPRRVVVRSTGPDSLQTVSRAIRARSLFTSVTTVALVPSAARFLQEGDRERADVVIYTAPTRVVAPTDLPAKKPATR